MKFLAAAKTGLLFHDLTEADTGIIARNVGRKVYPESVVLQQGAGMLGQNAVLEDAAGESYGIEPVREP